MPALLSALGGLTLLIALALLARAIIGDRARGRRRCPRCWYDMAGAPDLRCPECGHEAGDERALARTRRRPARFAIALSALLLAAALFAAPAILAGSWVRAIPSTVLIGAFPTCTRIIEDPTSAAAPTAAKLLDELARRADKGPLWDWQRRALIRRSVDVYERTTAKEPRAAASSHLRRSAAFAGPHLPRLLDVIAREGYNSNLLAQAHGLCREHLPDPEAVIERLFTALESGKLAPLSRVDTINVLLAIGGDEDRLLPYLRSGIRETTPAWGDHRRTEHIHAIANLSKLTRHRQQTVPMLAELALSADTTTSTVAIETLGEIGPDATPAADALLEVLAQTEESSRRMWIMRAIFHIGPKAGIAASALGAIDDGERAHTRLIHQLALLRLNGHEEGVFDLLSQWAAASDEQQRESAFWILGEMVRDSDRAVPLLARALANVQVYEAETEAGTLAAREQMGRSILRKLAAHGRNAGPAVDAIGDYLRWTTDPSMKLEALWTLERIGPDAAKLRPELRKLARDEYWLVRNQAQRVLLKLSAEPD